MILLGKKKVHELAKELNLTSKELIERANELKIEVKSHMSVLEDDAETALRKSFEGKKEPESKEKKKDKPDTPVIIRREVIISDEETAKKEEEEKRKKQQEKKEQIGFVQRDRNKDYNIVYRNKPNKPMTVNELFGFKEKGASKPAEADSQPIQQEKQPVVETEETAVRPEQRPPVRDARSQPERTAQPNTRNFRDRDGVQQNNNYRNNNNRPNNYNRDNNTRPNYRNDNQGPNNNYRNNNQGGPNNNYRNNAQGPNSGFRNNFRKPLDERGIEKNIKNIMATDIVEKETVREYTKSIDKQKENSRYEERTKKARGRKDSEEFNEEKLKNLKQENRLSNMFEDHEGGMLDYYDLTTIRGKRNKKKTYQDNIPARQKIFKLTEITIPESISVKDLAAELKKTTAEVIKKLLGYGIMATLNNELDFDTAFLIAGEFGVTAIKKEAVSEEDVLFDDSEDKEEELITRPPVIVVMGHVDHGKTSLLDAIRSTNVIEGEAGGITQHIGAYQVKVNNRDITFLDTPGHEAFTAMRARGAQLTDIAILVVAANDGVMPQTVEAINHAKSADIPIIVAVNKIDLPGADVEKIKQELMAHELVSEEWGGDTIFVPISAKKRINIEQLLEMVLLVADVKELKTNPDKQAKGVVIEAKLDKAKGPIATMLVQRGTLNIGDTIVVGSSIGRIKAMTNDKGATVKRARTIITSRNYGISGSTRSRRYFL